MTKLVLLLLLMGAQGCAWNSTNYNRKLEKYVGQPEYILYQEWGEPSSVDPFAPDQKEVTFVREYTEPQGWQFHPYSYFISDSAVNQGYTAEVGGPYYCNTSFTVTDGIVTDYTFSGDDCVAY